MQNQTRIIIENVTPQLDGGAFYIKRIVGTLRCNLLSKPLDGFMTMHKGKVESYAAVTHAKGRPLNQREVMSTLRVNQYIVCHYSAKDPIYRKRIQYRALDDRVHTRLFGK